MRSVLAAVAAAVLAAGPVAASPLDPAVVLDPAAPRAGEVVRAPRRVAGLATAPEGVVRVELYVVRGGVPRAVAALAPTLPSPSLGFAFDWDAGAEAPGTVDLRVVATTLLRGAAAEVRGLVVPARPARRAADLPPRAGTVPPQRPAGAAAPAPGPDRSAGVYLGGYDDELGYDAVVGDSPVPLAPTGTGLAVGRAAVDRRRAAVPIATGVLVLLCAAHVHRALRGLDGKVGP